MNATAAGPVLRDIHLPPPPSWWPPAWGWWVLAALLLIAIVALIWKLRRDARARRRAAALRREFESALAAPDAAARVAAVSERLRRAACTHDRAAAVLHGEAWLRFLDGGDPQQPFSRGAGRVLADGPFRRAIGDDELAALLPHARRRYLELAAPRKRASARPASRPGRRDRERMRAGAAGVGHA